MMIGTSDSLAASSQSASQSASARAHAARSSEQHARAHRQLAERIRAELTRDGHGELTRVTIHCDGHWVELTGNVSSFYLKQRAQEAVRRVAPGRQVFNEVRVVAPATRRAH